MDVVVLCYHSLSDTWPDPLAVRPSVFEAQLEWALQRGYTPATFAQAVLEPPAPKTFAVTFDDGWRSVQEIAWPIMQRLGVMGTVFVSTAYTDVASTERRRGPVLDQYAGTEHEHELYTLPWENLHELDEDGWEVASHSVHHPLLTTLDDETLAHELTESRRRLTEEFGRECLTLAYPTGDHDDRVVRFAREAGYGAAGTLPTVFPRKPDPLAYPRLAINRPDTLGTFKLKFSRASRFLRATPVASLGARTYRTLRAARS